MNKSMLRKSFAGRAVPGILALLLNSVYVVVDGFFVARLIGRDALAAVTVAVPVMEVLIALAMLISVGAGALISQQQGRGEEIEARQTFNASFRLLLGFSIIVAVVGLLLHGVIGQAVGGTPEIMPLVRTYLLYLFGFSPFLMFSFGLGAWARNDGQHKLAMVAMGAGTVVNIVLDYALIEWVGMGIGGAALATGLGPVVSCAILLPHFLRRKGTLYFERVKVRFAQAKAILFSGIPSFLMEFSLGLTTLCVNIAVSRHMGALGLAANGVVGYVALIGLTIYLGMAEGTQPLFSFYYGREDERAVQYLLRLSLIVCAVSGVLFYLLLLVGARVPAVVFGGQDETLVSMSMHAMSLYFPALFASGMNIQLSSCLQSIGRWQRSAVVSGLRSLVLLSLLLTILPLFLGNTGVWIAVPIAELLTLPIALYLYKGTKQSPQPTPTKLHPKTTTTH